jgi:hypothetical protein
LVGSIGCIGEGPIPQVYTQVWGYLRQPQGVVDDFHALFPFHSLRLIVRDGEFGRAHRGTRVICSPTGFCLAGHEQRKWSFHIGWREVV